MGFLSSLLIIVSSLAAGVLVGRMASPRLPSKTFEGLRRVLQGTALLVLNPMAFLGALWSLPAVDGRLILLPLVGLGTLAAAFGLGALAARWARLDPERALLFRTGASFTNLGNLGALAVFLLLGERGFALVPLYKLFEELWIYGFLFPYTKTVGARIRRPEEAPTRSGWAATLGPVFRDPFVLVALASVALGLGLHASGLVRPWWYGPLNSVLVPTSSVLLLVSLGMGLRLSFSPGDVKPALGLTALKVLALPLVSLALTGLCGFWTQPLVWKTALILSAMPMAFLSLIPPALYGLDQRFPATAWAFTMVSLAVTLPVLGWIVVVM
jgi:predicted permease